MKRFARELLAAGRSLRRTPAVAISAVFSLTLGIGATVAIASAVDRALVQPLAFREPDRLVSIYRTGPQSDSWPFSASEYLFLAGASRELESFAVLRSATALVTLSTETRQVTRLRASGNFFGMLGVRPLRGRLIDTADDRVDQARVVVLSEEFWTTYLGRDPDVVGRSIQVDGEAALVVGIVPAGLRVPHGSRLLRADVWEPARFTRPELAPNAANIFLGVGRLARGASVAGAERELEAVHGDLVVVFPYARGESVRVTAIQPDGVKAVRMPLLLLLAAVAIVLLIAATNVACLLLARGVQRRREMAIRLALGANRWAVMRPALAESVLITVAGATCGFALALVGVRTIGAMTADRIPQLAGLALDSRMFAFALLLSLVVAALCGAGPAWRGTTVDPQDALRAGRGAGAGTDHHRALAILVIVEVSLSLVLLIGAGLALRGFSGLLRSNPGFDPSPVLTVETSVSPARYRDSSSVARFLEPALNAIGRLPGVEQVGAVSLMPYRNNGWNDNIRYEGQPGDDPGRLPSVEIRSATPGFFAATRQRVVRGRLFMDTDDSRTGAQRVVVVNEALALRDFPGRDPIGARFYASDSGFATIVGVVSDIRDGGRVGEPIGEAQPEMYWSYRQNDRDATTFNLLVRTTGSDPLAIARAVERALRSVDPDVAIVSLMPMNDVISGSVGRQRALFALLAAFAAIALLLASAGLYGVLSYVVAQRSRELGIRSALGGTTADMILLVTRRGMGWVAIGIAIGLITGAGVTRIMTSMLYGVDPLDPSTWVFATLVLGVFGLVATVVPAYRASRIDPALTLRAE